MNQLKIVIFIYFSLLDFPQHIPVSTYSFCRSTQAKRSWSVVYEQPSPTPRVSDCSDSVPPPHLPSRPWEIEEQKKQLQNRANTALSFLWTIFTSYPSPSLTHFQLTSLVYGFPSLFPPALLCRLPTPLKPPLVTPPLRPTSCWLFSHQSYEVNSPSHLNWSPILSWRYCEKYTCVYMHMNTHEHPPARQTSHKIAFCVWFDGWFGVFSLSFCFVLLDAFLAA